MSMKRTDEEFFIKKPYDAPWKENFACEGESMTKQSFKAECDVNTIMARYQKTGVVEHANQYQGDYGNFIGVMDFHSAMNYVVEAKEMFLELPSEIRNRFGNDPGAFLEFVGNDENRDEMVKLGLINENVPPEGGEAGGPSPGEAPQPAPPAPAETPTAAAE